MKNHWEQMMKVLGIIWNLMGTYSEPDGTYWKHQKYKKSTSPPKWKKKTEPLGCMLHHLNDNIFFLFLNLFITILLTSSSCLREPFSIGYKVSHSSSFFQVSFFKILVSVLVPHTNQTENLVPISALKRFEFSFQFQNSDLVPVQSYILIHLSVCLSVEVSK